MVEATLNRLYYSLNEQSALSGVNRLHSAARLIHPDVTKKEVTDWLRKQDTYTLYKPARRRLRAEPRIYVKHIDDQWSIDLCDMTNVAASNQEYRYILTCIDVFSKFAWAEPLKTKSGSAVTAAMNMVLQRTRRTPKRIHSDKGTEFYNPQFRRLVTQIGALHFSSNSRHKASVVERFNRTLKVLLYRSFAARNSNDWVSVLQDVLNVYNNRYHRSIKMTPSSVNKLNEKVVWRNLFGKKPKRGVLYSVGQLVRISKIKRVFEKGYLPNYTEEVFRITNVFPGPPYKYRLVDLMDEEISGRFVADELTPVDKKGDQIWKIEKVLKQDSRGRYLVKWLGFPTKFNSWVNSIELI